MPLPALSMSIVAFAQHLAVAIGLLAAGQVMRDTGLRTRTMDSLSGAYAHLTASSLALIDAIPSTLALTPTRATITVTSVPRTIPVAQPPRTVFITAAQPTRAPTAPASPLSTSVHVSGPAAAEHARARRSEPPTWSFWHAILVAIVLDSLGYAVWLTRKHHLDPAARALLASSRPVILRGVNWANSHGVLSVRHTMLVAQAAITRRRQIDALAAKDIDIAVAAGKLLYSDSILAQRTAQLMAVTFALDTEAGRTRAVADELDAAVVDRDAVAADRDIAHQQLGTALNNVNNLHFQVGNLNGQLAAAQLATSQAQQAEAVAQQAIQRLQTDLAKTTASRNEVSAELVKRTFAHTDLERELDAARLTIRRSEDAAARAMASRTDVEAKARQDAAAHSEAVAALQGEHDADMKATRAAHEVERKQVEAEHDAVLKQLEAKHEAVRQQFGVKYNLVQQQLRTKREELCRAQTDLVTAANRVHIAERKLSPLTAALAESKETHRREMESAASAQRDAISEVTRRSDDKIASVVAERDAAVASITKERDGRVAGLESVILEYKRKIGALVTDRDRAVAALTVVVQQREVTFGSTIAARNSAVVALSLVIGQREDTLGSAIARGERKITSLIADGQNQLAAATMTRDRLQGELTEALSARKNLDTGLARAEQRSQELESSLAAALAERRASQDNLDAVQQQLGQARDNALTSVAAITTERDNAVASVDTITQRLAAAEAQVVALQASSSYADLMADNAALESKIKRARVELDRAVAQGKSASIKAFGFGRCFGSLPIDASTLVAVKLGPELVSRAPATRAQLARWHPDRLGACDPMLRKYGTALSQVLSQALDAGGLVDRVVDFNTALNRSLNSACRVFPHDELNILIQGFREHHAEVRAQTLRVDGKEDEAAEPMTDTEELILVLLALEPWRVQYPGTDAFSPMVLPAADRQLWRSPRCEVAGPPPPEKATPSQEDPMDTS